MDKVVLIVSIRKYPTALKTQPYWMYAWYERFHDTEYIQKADLKGLQERLASERQY